MARFLLIIIGLSFFSFNSSAKRMAPEFYKSKSMIDGNLKKNESIFQFQFQSLDYYYQNQSITYSIDGKQSMAILDSFEFTVRTTPGKHIFQIYIDDAYYEMYSDSLEIGSKAIDTYYLFPRYSIIQIEVDKPLIYLYPERKQKISVEVVPTGKMKFTYPEMNEEWNVIANPNGTIEYNKNEYNYLFWESTQEFNFSGFDLNTGYVVEGKDITDFLENKLNDAGFNSFEMADFITYWGPQMINHPHLFIKFHQNEECNQFARLNIEPQPDHTNRFYMSWLPISSNYNPKPQTISRFNRSGFSVIEWGGQELHLQKTLSR